MPQILALALMYHCYQSPSQCVEYFSCHAFAGMIRAVGIDVLGEGRPEIRSPDHPHAPNPRRVIRSGRSSDRRCFLGGLKPPAAGFAHSGNRTSVYLHHRIGVLKLRPARSRGEPTRPQWFVFTPIQVDLPPTKPATGIDHSPSCIAKDLLHCRL
jgi:hypothetical protein